MTASANAADFTDEELLAYIAEQLPAERASQLETQLRGTGDCLGRLLKLLQSAECGDVTLGGMWRRGRWSCPPRAVWAGYVSGRLGDGLTQYLQFHLNVIGCRVCEANMNDLQRSSGADCELRVHKFFHSSAGRLKSSDD